jgi:hypothetical protein
MGGTHESGSGPPARPRRLTDRRGPGAPPHPAAGPPPP